MKSSRGEHLWRSRAAEPLGTYSLVVMEEESLWPLHADLCASSWIAIRRMPSESYAGLVERATLRARQILKEGGGIDDTLLSCNDVWSERASADRVAAGRALLGIPTGQLTLLGPSYMSDEKKGALSAVATELRKSAPGAAAEIRVAFEDVGSEKRSSRIASCTVRAGRAEVLSWAPVSR